MKKKLVLLMTAAAMMGLSACDDGDTTEDCTDNAQKCEDNNVWLCMNGQWELKTACIDGKTCNVDTLTCETAIVCTNGEKRCNDKDIMICNDGLWKVDTKCEGDEYCSIETFSCTPPATACTVGTKRCEGKTVEICDMEKGWIVETQCKTNEVCNADTKQCEITTVICINDDKRCNANVVEVCTDNDWTLELACGDKVCNESSYTCEDVVVTCENGKKRCNANVVEVCAANAWKEELACGDKTCNESSYTCDNAKSSITWCNSQHLDSAGKITYGRVLDSRDTKDPSTIDAKVLCGTIDQKLNEYQAIAGVHNAACDSCGNNFEYAADLSGLGNGEYLCMWSFALAGQDAVACKTNEAGIESNLSTIPSTSVAFEYTVAGANRVWNTLIDFENFKKSPYHDNQEAVTTGNITTSIFGAIMTASVASINAQTLVFSSKVADGYVIISNTESAKLNELSFDYKSYGDDDFSTYDIERALKIYINEDTSPIYTLPLVGKVTPHVNVKIDIDKDVKSVKIHRDYGDNTNAYPRFCIDNIKLTGSL